MTTSVDITTVSAGGELFIEDVVIKTGGVGLATGTTFRVVSNNANGTTTVLLTRISKLGVGRTVSLATELADLVNASPALGVNAPTVLEAGKKLSVSNTDAASTGAGTIDVYIKFRRMSDTASIKAA